MIPNDTNNPSETITIIIVRGGDSTEPTPEQVRAILAAHAEAVAAPPALDWNVVGYLPDEGHPYKWPEVQPAFVRGSHRRRDTSGLNRPRQLESGYG